jgi:hypothetical protein
VVEEESLQNANLFTFISEICPSKALASMSTTISITTQNRWKEILFTPEAVFTLSFEEVEWAHYRLQK